MLLGLGCGVAGGGSPDGGPSGGRDAAWDGGGAPDASVDGSVDGSADGGSAAALGPRALLERLDPSLSDLANRSLDELLIGWADERRTPPGLSLPASVTLDLTPEAPSPTPARLCLRWGIMTSGTLALPSPKWSAELLGQRLVGGDRVPARGCGFTRSASDIYGCRPECWEDRPTRRPLVGRTDPPASAEELDALLDRLGRDGPGGVPPVRLLHPFMVAYPCAEDGTPEVRTDRAAILTSQFSTTGNGWAWASAFEESGVSGDNDVQGAEEIWQQAWELSAREGAFTLWVGDVSFPRRWYPAAPRSADNPLGIRCGPSGVPQGSGPVTDPDWGWDHTGWWDANSFTGLQFFATHVAAAAAPDAPLPDRLLATFSAMPYVRATMSAATLLQRIAEEVVHADIVPKHFSTAGASKGGMGCIYSVLADPRIEHGVCEVFDALDASGPADMMHRMVTDWGICAPDGIRADGCATGNFTGFLGPQLLPYLDGESAALGSLRETWELGTVLPRLKEAAPEAQLFLLNGYPDVHWSLGSNDRMWTERPPPTGQVWLVHRLNADHGMHHRAPDDVPEGLSPQAWSHGADKAIAYRAFFDAHEPPRIRLLEAPRREGRRLVARAQVEGGAAVRGVRAWVAASRDRDFSLCTGIELGAEALMCRGEFLCQTHPAVSGEACPGAPLAGPCAWLDDLADARAADPSEPSNREAFERLAEANPLPTRTPSGHFCWWRRAETAPGARPAWQQCVAPQATLAGAPDPATLELSSWLDPGDGRQGLKAYLASEDAFARVLLRANRGTYADLPRPEAEAGLAGRDPTRTPLPATFRFRAFGAASHEGLLDAGGFINPYARTPEGEFAYWDSGFFVPRPAVLQPDGTIDFSWTLPDGSDVDHFAVTLEAWTDPLDGLPDVVYTPVLTVAPDPDPDVRSCSP